MVSPDEAIQKVDAVESATTLDEVGKKKEDDGMTAGKTEIPLDDLGRKLVYSKVDEQDFKMASPVESIQKVDAAESANALNEVGKKMEDDVMSEGNPEIPLLPLVKSLVIPKLMARL